MAEDSPPPPSPAPSAPKRKRRPLPLRKKLAFVGVLVVFLLLGLEGGLRVLGYPEGTVGRMTDLLEVDPAAFDQSVGVFSPGAQVNVAYPVELGYRVGINSLGLRGAEVALEAPADRPRVLVLGDSATFGFYVEDHETFPAQLQAQLGSAGSPAEVINAGCGGWSINSETLLYEERAHRLDPDLVVVLYCSNDITDMLQPQPLYELQKSNLGKAGGGGLLSKTAIYELVFDIKVAFKRWRRRMKDEPVVAPLTSADLPEDQRATAWASYTEWLTRLRDGLRARETPLLVLYQADCYKLQEGLPASDEDRLGALCGDLGVAFHSLRPPVEARPVTETFFIEHGDYHPNAVGYGIMAESAAAFLRDNSATLGLDGERGTQ